MSRNIFIPEITETEWHNIVVWGKQAEIVEKWVKRGQQLYFEGKIKTRPYEDKEGEKKYITDINCTSFQMLKVISLAKEEYNKKTKNLLHIKNK